MKRAIALFVAALATPLGVLGCIAHDVSVGETQNKVEAPPNNDPPPPAPPDYPAGPYGNDPGKVVPNFEWDEGYRDGTGEAVKISMNDYFDPTGKKGIKAIKLTAAAEW